VDAAKCVGCGICENKCPVGEEAAIRVTSVGETRDPLNRLLAGGSPP
jgi:ferredoxin